MNDRDSTATRQLILRRTLPTVSVWRSVSAAVTTFGQSPVLSYSPRLQLGEWQCTVTRTMELTEMRGIDSVAIYWCMSERDCSANEK